LKAKVFLYYLYFGGIFDFLSFIYSIIMDSSLNLNKSHISISLTPETFLQAYTSVYNSDKDVSVARQFALIFSIIFMITGIIGNFINIWILFQKKLREHKFNLYLLVMSILKFIFCSTLLLDYLFSKFYLKSTFFHNFHRISYVIIDFIIHTSDSSISFLSVFLSLDRLYAIKYPLKIKEFITNLHAQFLIGISLFTLFISKILSSVICEINIGNNNHLFYCTVASPFIFNTIPLLIILILNTLLIKSLISYLKKKRRNSIEFLARNSISLITMNNSKNSYSEKMIELKESKNVNSIQHRTKKNYSAEVIELKDLKRKSILLNSSISLRKFSKKHDQQKRSHYVVIIISDIWSILTSIPYYSFNYYFILFQLNIFNLETVIILQIISSIFFNSNHSLSFFMYFCFYEDFRTCLKSMLQSNKKKSVSIAIF
jgi:hypothetical protein